MFFVKCNKNIILACKHSFITVRKRSVEQGNIFTSVCLCPQRGLHMMSLPVWLPGPVFLLRGLCPGGFLSNGSLSRGPLSRVISREISWNQKRRWYTSYWNFSCSSWDFYCNFFHADFCKKSRQIIGFCPKLRG